LPGRRAWRKAFSFSVSHFAVAGKSGSRNQTAMPKRMVTRPSKRKSHCHPERPWAPLTWEKAKARTPLKTPERLPRTSGRN
jgi:hypothetical protein